METPKTDAETVAAVREAVDRYFAAIDSWESAYRRFYRMPGVAKPSEDMAPEQREFEACRRELEGLLPSARSVCFRFGRPDVFAGLTRVDLGAMPRNTGAHPPSGAASEVPLRPA